MSTIILNIDKYFNHKMFYDRMPTDDIDFGLDGVCILKKDFDIEDVVHFNNVDFRMPMNDMDNVCCERQEIEVNGTAKAINILGFAYWGDCTEYFTIVFKDGSTQIVKALLPDWSSAYVYTIFGSKCDIQRECIKTAKVFVSSGKLLHLIYLHHNRLELNCDKVISKIILPDNMFLHIFAVTLED